MNVSSFFLCGRTVCSLGISDAVDTISAVIPRFIIVCIYLKYRLFSHLMAVSFV